MLLKHQNILKIPKVKGLIIQSGLLVTIGLQLLMNECVYHRNVASGKCGANFIYDLYVNLHTAGELVYSPWEPKHPY